MPQTIFRPATPDDALCISVLAMQVFLETYAREGIRPDLAREALGVYSPAVFAAYLADAGSYFVLAERDAHLVAFAQCKLGSAPPLELLDGLAGQAELSRLYVQSPFKRTGLGRELLGRAEANARARGASGMWLAAWAGNAAARTFYAAQNYVDVGKTAYVIEGQTYENRVFTRRF